MSYRTGIGSIVFILLMMVCPYAFSGNKKYVLIIGNNTPPADSELTTLQYADDDAVRFFRFFKTVSDSVFLMTVPDGETQKRYPEIVNDALVPSWENFNAVIRRLKAKISADRVGGDTSVFYLVFSGHGAYGDADAPFLSLIGGGLTQEKLFDSLALLNADFVHLFVDACYAEGVVGSRRMFDFEMDSRAVRLSRDTIQTAVGERLDGFPGLGVVMASSDYHKTHEWSQIESGIFTHEVLSGLAGPADINHDGKIEYSELVAFISSANRDVNDSRARIKVIAKPPERNHSFPLVDLGEMTGAAFLIGDPSSFGHFHIDLANGERYLDANLAGVKTANIAVPANRKAYLTVGDREAVLGADRDGVVEIALLNFVKSQYSHKGSIEAAFSKGLFKSEYGLLYYKGFIDNTDFKSVLFNVKPLRLATHTADSDRAMWRRKRALATTSYAVAGVSAITAAVFGGMTLKARRDFESTDLESSSYTAREDYKKYSAVFWPSVALVPIAILVGWLLMPEKWWRESNRSPSAMGYRDDRLLFKLRF